MTLVRAQLGLGRVGALYLFDHRLPTAHHAIGRIKRVSRPVMKRPAIIKRLGHLVAKLRCVIC